MDRAYLSSVTVTLDAIESWRAVMIGVPKIAAPFGAGQAYTELRVLADNERASEFQ